MATQQQGSSGSATQTKAKEEAVVEYVGSADEVKISAADWRKAGLEVKEGDEVKQTLWNRSNRMKVKASDLSAEQLEILGGDDRFKLPKSEG